MFRLLLGNQANPGTLFRARNRGTSYPGSSHQKMIRQIPQLTPWGCGSAAGAAAGASLASAPSPSATGWSTSSSAARCIPSARGPCSSCGSGNPSCKRGLEAVRGGEQSGSGHREDKTYPQEPICKCECGQLLAIRLRRGQNLHYERGCDHGLAADAQRSSHQSARECVQPQIVISCTESHQPSMH